MTFEVLPVVHLDQGRFPELPAADPERALTDLGRRFGRVALVDVEGVRANDPDLEFIQAASRRRSLWVDAGSRYATDAMDLTIAGAEWVTMRWNTLRDAKELDEAAQVFQPGTLFVGVEFPRGGFLRHPKDARSAGDVVRLAESLDLGVVFVLDQADASFLRGLPTSTGARYVQGVDARVAAEARALGFTGALLAPVELPEVSA